MRLSRCFPCQRCHFSPLSSTASLYSLSLRSSVLYKDFYCVLLLELADESRIPKLAGDTQILAAPHQGIALGSFAGRSDAIDVKVLLLTPSSSYVAAVAYKDPFPGYDLGSYVGLSSWSHRPATMPKGLGQYPSIPDDGGKMFEGIRIV